MKNFQASQELRMKTDELVAMLAAQAEPVDPAAVRRRFFMHLIPGVFMSTALMVGLLGIRPDIAAAAQLPMFWVKLLLPLLAALASLSIVSSLARPGMRLAPAPKLILPALLAFLWLLAVVSLMQAEPGTRQELIFGNSWLKCLFLIPFLSLPVFAAAFWTLKGWAPTRPRLTGAAAGLLAGTASAAIYALHCAELTAPFIAIWYVIGMLIPAGIGALIGNRLLRW